MHRFNAPKYKNRLPSFVIGEISPGNYLPTTLKALWVQSIPQSRRLQAKFLSKPAGVPGKHPLCFGAGYDRREALRHLDAPKGTLFYFNAENQPEQDQLITAPDKYILKGILRRAGYKSITIGSAYAPDIRTAFDPLYSGTYGVSPRRARRTL